VKKTIENHDDESRLSLPEKLREDIKGLYQSSSTIPPEIDRAILDQAHQHFARPRQRRIRLISPWKIAAAAAVIIFAFSLFLTRTFELGGEQQLPVTYQATDIDHNGRVDILDAFTLARQIEQAGHIKSEWDLNGDGQVDRSDVDTVALAAVRLDKGVL
jgi:hypothetical protein